MADVPPYTSGTVADIIPSVCPAMGQQRVRANDWLVMVLDRFVFFLMLSSTRKFIPGPD